MPIKDPIKKRAYQRKWLKARREAWFTGKVCADCGSDKDLQLDHKDPSLKIDHRIWSWSKDRREAELDKCQALCSPCHKKKTAKDYNQGQVHGTANSYGYYKCRCSECTDAVRIRVNEYRWRTGRRKKST